jgi:hypothetical protein
MSATIYFDTKSSGADINDCLARNGIAVISEFFSGNDLEKIKNEFSDFVDINNPGGSYQLEKSKGQRFIFSDLSQKEFPMITSIAGNSHFNAIADDFFGQYPYKIASVYGNWDVDSMKTDTDWHTDGRTMLKFFIYLTDTDKDNGAFKFNLGSHREGYYRMLHSRLSGDVNCTFFSPESEILHPVDVEAKAGSVIIFNTNGIHRAGEMSEGYERQVLRYHLLAEDKRYAYQLLDRFGIHRRRFLDGLLGKIPFFKEYQKGRLTDVNTFVSSKHSQQGSSGTGSVY